MGQATQTDTQTQTLEEALNKTDFGHTLYENRKLLLGIILAIVVAVTGWVGWKESKRSAAMNNSMKVFEFQNNAWANTMAGKMTPAELVKTFSELDKEVQTAPVMIPVALEMGKYLFDKGSLAEAEAILSKIDGVVTHPVGAFFIGMQRAVVLEKLGQVDTAIVTLENLLKNKEMLMPARVSTELARLYIGKGDKAKAQSQLDYVISTFPNDEQAKIAKLYLAQMAQ